MPKSKERSARALKNEARNEAQHQANIAWLDSLGTKPFIGETPSKTLRRIARAGKEPNPDAKRKNDTPPARPIGDQLKRPVKKSRFVRSK